MKMAPFRVHTIKFYDPEPLAIHSMATEEKSNVYISPDTGKHMKSSQPCSAQLALSRSDNSVEVWDVLHAPVLQKYIPPLPDVQIECVGLFEKRLFAAGLHGFLYEMDYHKLEIKEKLAVTSGPAWCLDICKPTKQIAVGTEEGYVNIFNILKDSLEFHRLLDKQEGRILCTAWHPQGTYLATGSIDTIRVWAPTSGHPVARMKTGRKTKEKETIVWSIAMTEDFVVITGDSNGRTSFWNGENGTHMYSVQSHDADVLTLKLNHYTNRMFSCGVDPIAYHFQEIRQANGERKWVKSLHKKISNHDVRCLALWKNDYCVGGTDTYLTIVIPPKRNLNAEAGKEQRKEFPHTIRMPCLPKDGIIELAGDTRLCLLKYRSNLEVWRLGESDEKTGSRLQLSQGPIRILKLETASEEKLLCSTINKAGNLIAYSTKKRFRIFALVWDKENLSSSCSIEKMKLVDSTVTPPHSMRFYQSDGNDFLLCGYGTPRIESFSVGKSGVSSSWFLQGDSFDTPEQLNLSSSIQHISISGTTAVVSDYENQVVALDLKKGTVISKMPCISTSCITSLTISPNGTTCVMAYSDKQIAQIEIKTARFTPFCTAFKESLKPQWEFRTMPIAGLNYLKDDQMLLYDYENLIVIDEENEFLEPEKKVLRSKANLDDSHTLNDGGNQYNLGSKQTFVKDRTRIHPFPNLVSALPLNSNSIVCVEMSSEQIDKKLPPSMTIKTWGCA